MAIRKAMLQTNDGVHHAKLANMCICYVKLIYKSIGERNIYVSVELR